ncbi:Serine/threonine-protein kinase [Echinococcus granulosus]|uniref:Serine/threonine-protein kinase n=1 Tax=Echinococcus granulosus TaxID=6210 RepID=W6U2S1_ECHGR|nr:Serine/threonine-protein kinase [Echinococcus granulosus]EUB55410.1 Serine/threonine-protein kinase [Echinococcus granulosus]
MAEEHPPPTPTLTVEAIKNAVLQLYCLEDMSMVGKLGSGFYANVYLVYHRPSKRKLALKISPSGNIQRREIEILRGLRHENVQRIAPAMRIFKHLNECFAYIYLNTLHEFVTLIL